MTDPYAKMFQQMMESSQEMLRAFQSGSTPSSPQTSQEMPPFEAMFPNMSPEMMEMWFGRSFNRDGLDAKTRLLITLAALTIWGAQAEMPIKLAIRHALIAGAKEREITEAIWQVSMFSGPPAMQKALEIAQGVFADQKESKNDPR